MGLGETLPESLPKASAEALPKSLPKAWGEPPPYEGVISSESGAMNSECRTCRDRRENPLDKNSYHAYAGIGR
jgi:hypothetical protein